MTNVAAVLLLLAAELAADLIVSGITLLVIITAETQEAKY
jgi:hypothetical protein